MPLQFSDGSTASEVTITSNLAAFGNNASESRIVWVNFTTTPAATRSILSQGGGGASNLTYSTSTFSISRDYLTTDALAATTFASAGIGANMPVCLASVINAAVPSLYAGTLVSPLRETAAYSLGPTTGVGTLVDKSANSVRIGGFSGVAQGFCGIIYFAAWFNVALTVAELNEIKMLPLSGSSALLNKYRTKAIGWWRPGVNGTTAVLDETGRGGNGLVTGANVAPDVFVDPLRPFPWPSVA